MDLIKNAFDNVKKDIDNLKESMQEIKKELSQIQLSILNLTKNRDFNTSTHNLNNKTLRHINQTPLNSSTHTSTHNYNFQALKPQNSNISIGNEGVSTDRQTDRQTDKYAKNTEKTPKNTIPNPSLILSQLDDLKKDLMLKIKKLTNQEMLVFSTIYQLENTNETVDYNLLSIKLNLSQSSIRDYIQRSIAKGIPIIKEKINNKKIILHISEDFKKLATLNTLLQLREL